MTDRAVRVNVTVPADIMLRIDQLKSLGYIELNISRLLSDTLREWLDQHGS